MRMTIKKYNVVLHKTSVISLVTEYVLISRKENDTTVTKTRQGTALDMDVNVNLLKQTNCLSKTDLQYDMGEKSIKRH